MGARVRSGARVHRSQPDHSQITARSQPDHSQIRAALVRATVAQPLQGASCYILPTYIHPTSILSILHPPDLHLSSLHPPYGAHPTNERVP